MVRNRITALAALLASSILLNRRNFCYCAARLTKTARETLSVPHVGMPA